VAAFTARLAGETRHGALRRHAAYFVAVLIRWRMMALFVGIRRGVAVFGRGSALSIRRRAGATTRVIADKAHSVPNEKKPQLFPRFYFVESRRI